MRVLQVLCMGVVISVLAGCVSKPVEEEAHMPPLMIAQNSDGEVTLAWKSEVGRVYSVYYQNRPSDDWRVVRGANRRAGTGETLTVYDLTNPRGPARRYRLLLEQMPKK